MEKKPVSSLAPNQVHSKVGAGAAGGSLAVVLVWGLGQFGVELPPEVSVSIGSIFAFVAGYIAKE